MLALALTLRLALCSLSDEGATMARQPRWRTAATRYLSRLLGIEQKRAPFIWPTMQSGEVHWGLGNFMDYVTDGFEVNALIYSSVMYKVRAISQPQLKIYDYEGAVIDDDRHPLMKLRRRPNEYQSWAGFNGNVETYLNLSGNAYVYLDRGKDQATEGPVVSMYTLRPDRVFIVPRDGLIAGYIYVPEGTSRADAIPILPENIIHFKFPNPADRFEGLGYGLSPVAPMARAGDVDNQITRFLKIFFDRGALPAGILKHNMPLEKEDIAAIRARWRETYGGVDNWAEVGVLDSDTEYQRIGYNFSEMGFESIDDRNESRSPMPFGVPPILIGSKFGMKNSTYSNYGQARLAFWQDTMTYEIQIQESEYTNRLRQKDGSYLAFDISTVPAFSKDLNQQVKSAKELWTMGVPPRIAFSVVGLRVGDYPGIDLSTVQTGAQGVQDDQDEAAPPDQGGTKRTAPRGHRHRPISKSDGGDDDDEDHRAGLELKKLMESAGRDVIEFAEKRLGDYMKAADELFDEELGFVLATIGDQVSKAYETRASISWSTAIKPLEEYYASFSPTEWRTKFAPLLAGTAEDIGDSWSLRTGIRFNVRNLLAERWFSEYTLKFAQPIAETTSDTVKSILTQAQEEGWSIGQTQQAMTAAFQTMKGEAADPDTVAFITARLPAHRTEMIARTELIRAANAGSNALFKNWGCATKGWSAASDARTRESHRLADGQEVGIDELFTVGGKKMAHPGDMTNGAGLDDIVNCRCAVVPGTTFITPEVKPVGTTPGKPAGEVTINPPKDIPAPPIPDKVAEQLHTSMVEAAIIDSARRFRSIEDIASEESDGDESAKKNWIARWKGVWSRRIEGLSKGVVESIKAYTGMSYQEINNILRRIPKPYTTEFSKRVQQIKDIDSAMSQLSLDENMILYRGRTKNFIARMVPGVEAANLNSEVLDRLVGTSFVEQGYSSTSTLESVATGDFGGGVLMRIKAPSNTRGIYVESITRNAGEEEILLARETEFRIVGYEIKEGDPNGFLAREKASSIILDVEVVYQPESYDYDFTS